MKRVGLLLLFCFSIMPIFGQEIIIDEPIENNIVIDVDTVLADETDVIIQPENEIEQIQQEVTEEKTITEIIILESENEEDKREIELQTKLAEYLEAILDNEENLNIENNAESILNQIEEKKSELLVLRNMIAEKTSVYSKQIDDELRIQQEEILNAPISVAESNGTGGLSDSAANRRKNKCIELETVAERNKRIYERQVQQELGGNEKTLISELNVLYKSLESKNHHTTSYSSAVTVEVKDFNADEGCWILNFKCNMFNIDNIIDTSVRIPYHDVTGKKFISIDKMTEDEFTEFEYMLNLYSELFASMPQIFYTKLTFEVYRWKLASEYRMVPKSLEVTFLGKKNSNTVKITDNINARVFQLSPALEVRSKSEISNDAVKATKIIAAEAKAKETEADKFYKEYSSSYETNKKSSSSDPVIQKGRGAFIISADKNISTDDLVDAFSNFDLVKIIPGTVNLELDLPIGPFNFWGISTGVDVPLEPGKLRIEAGLNFGFNMIIANIIRPYIVGSAKADLMFNSKLLVGGGFDLMIAKTFLINFGYNYGWNYDFNNVLNPNIDKSTMTEEEKNSIPCTSLHKFSIGLGFAW